MKIDRALKRVEETIAEACHRVGRDGNSVRLVAVSKTFPIEYVKLAYEAGHRVFAESRAQEFREKVSTDLPGIQWHFIGHLQTNKIKYVAPEAALIHAVDSLHLAEEISIFALKNSLQVPCLLQVNTSGEESKFGLNPEMAEDVFLQIDETLPGVKLRGLMCMAPFVEDESVIRKSFSELRTLQERLQKQVSAGQVCELSMGMSHDYEIAVEEGSTLVRVGTAIFGSRGR